MRLYVLTVAPDVTDPKPEIVDAMARAVPCYSLDAAKRQAVIRLREIYPDPGDKLRIAWRPANVSGRAWAATYAEVTELRIVEVGVAT